MKNLNAYLGTKQILSDINLELGDNEILGIVGKSGCGKSTLLKIIMGLVDRRQYKLTGQIYFKNKDLLQLNPDDEFFRRIRGREIGMIWQNAQASLCPVRTIGEQIVETVNQHQDLTKQEIYQQAENLFIKIGFKHPKDILRAYPFELSGGMNQRVAIALAVLLKPEILLADEPTSALDVIVQAQVLEELMNLHKALHNSIILVTHNLAVVKHLADKIAVMNEGKIIEFATKYEIFTSPQQAYTKELLNSMMTLNITR